MGGASAISAQDTCWSWSARLLAVVTTLVETMLLFGLVWTVVLIPVNALRLGFAWPSAVVLGAAGGWLTTFTVRALRVAVTVDRLASTMRVRNVYRTYSLELASIATCRVRAPWEFRMGRLGHWPPAVVIVDDHGREIPITASVTDRQARRNDMLLFLRSVKLPDLPTREEYVRALGRYVGRDAESNR